MNDEKTFSLTQPTLNYSDPWKYCYVKNYENVQIPLFSQGRKECGKRGRKPGRKASSEKIDMKAKLGKLLSITIFNSE